MKFIHVVKISDGYAAYHESEKVAVRFAYNYKKSNPEEQVDLVRVPKKELQKFFIDDDLHLSFCDGIYIQERYKDIYQIEKDFLIEGSEYHKLLSQAYRLLESSDNRSERIALKKIIKIIKKEKKENYSYIPSIKYLNERYWDYQIYKERMMY